MAVGEMLVSPDIEGKLGKDGVAAVAASVWPVDCQTCGKPLGSRPPALCVDDMITFAAASLHHRQCRAPGWNQGPVAGFGGDLITHRTRLVMLPLDGGDGPAVIPVMLVNPSMEHVLLTEDGGAWRPQFNAAFTSFGMVPPGPQMQIYKPVTGASARLTPAAVTITMPQPSITDAYECTLAEGDERFAREIAGQGGIMLAVSHVVDPSCADLTGQFIAAIRAGRLLCGWVLLSGQ